MSFRQSLNDWTSIFLKIVVIIVIICGVSYLVLSIIGNVTENKMAEFPDDARYVVLLAQAGQIILTSDYEVISDGKYKLTGYYELVKGKWKEREAVLILDEKYCGEVVIDQR